MKRLFFLLVAACGTPNSKTSPASDFSPVVGAVDQFQYHDAHGAEVRRQILVEGLNGGGQRLLVVEWANDDNAMQRSIYDHHFGPNEGDALETARAEFASQNAPTANVAFPDADQTTEIWHATASWTTDAENTYSAWVAANANVDMFKGTGVSIDCADTALLIRWSYAHDHGLPAGNSMAGSGKLFGNWSMQAAWKTLAIDPDWRKDKRFLAAFAYLQNNTYTHSLENDLYPTILSRDYITPGSIHLMYEGATGHTETFTYLVPAGSADCGDDQHHCLATIWGNEPPSDQIFASELIGMLGEPNGQGGFLRHRWPVKSGSTWKLTTASAMPGYSLDQFQYASDTPEDFAQVIYDKLNIVLLPIDRAKIYVSTMAELLWERFGVTAEGYLMCNFGGCATTDPLYDQYSTPVRDQRLQKLSGELQQIMPQLSAADATTVTSQYAFPAFASLPAPLWTDYMLDTNGILEKMSSDPNADYFVRWGVTLPDADSAFDEYTGVAATLLDNNRWYLVYEAQQACFPNGATKATCSHTASTVTALATTRFDAHLRLLAAKITTLQAAASATAQQQMLTKTTQDVTESTGLCPASPQGYCDVADYLFGTTGMLQKMTSNPWDSEKARYGVQ